MSETIAEIMKMFFKLHEKAISNLGLEDNDIEIIEETNEGFFYSYKKKNYVSIEFVDDKRKNYEKFFIIRDKNEVELVNFKQ